MRTDAARNLESRSDHGGADARRRSGGEHREHRREAGVDRRTVYRRFAPREGLPAAIRASRMEAVESAIEGARPREAPVTVALHRYVENIVAVNRTWPVDLVRVPADDNVRARREPAPAGPVRGRAPRAAE